MNCDSKALLEAAKCFNCVPPNLLDAAQTYEFARVAGLTTDPKQLLLDAKQFIFKVPPGIQLAVQDKLLCDILDSLD